MKNNFFIITAIISFSFMSQLQAQSKEYSQETFQVKEILLQKEL
jgi:hypothetical protein